jgi:methionyl-tRNA formyltransferase
MTESTDLHRAQYNDDMSDRPRIVFMGSPDFAVPALRALAASYRVVGVVTQPDRPAGRGRTLVAPPVKEVARALGVPVIQPAKLRLPEAMEQLRAWAPDLIVVAAFGQILRAEVLDLPRLGCVNIHGSLLPRWRGAAPIQAAILAGDLETGITIMKMDPGVDTGPILAQRSLPIAPDDTAGSLFGKMAGLGSELLCETLPGIINGDIRPQPQDDRGATYAPMLRKEDGLLDFAQPAEALAQRVRAFNPWPGTWMDWQGAPLKIHHAHPHEGESEPGGRGVIDELPAVGTSQGWIVFDELQPAGKRPMPGRAFLSGARNWIEQ